MKKEKNSDSELAYFFLSFVPFSFSLPPLNLPRLSFPFASFSVFLSIVTFLLSSFRLSFCLFPLSLSLSPSLFLSVSFSIFFQFLAFSFLSSSAVGVFTQYLRSNYIIAWFDHYALQGFLILPQSPDWYPALSWRSRQYPLSKRCRCRVLEFRLRLRRGL